MTKYGVQMRTKGGQLLGRELFSSLIGRSMYILTMESFGADVVEEWLEEGEVEG